MKSERVNVYFADHGQKETFLSDSELGTGSDEKKGRKLLSEDPSWFLVYQATSLQYLVY